MKNYLYPFFWQHGESDAVLERYMDKIHSSGMQAVCVEARPHPEFVSDGWWEDMDIILKKAKEHEMKIWILDDSHFPTGFANGKIKSDYPEYRKLFLYQRRFDVVGPMKKARINASVLTGKPWNKPGLGDKQILGIYLAKRSNNYTETKSNIDAVDAESITEVEVVLENNIITLDIPSGAYSVFVVFTTYEGGEAATEGYLNPLMHEATQVLIDEVYKPHYEHYKEEFGKTITAFFSDEPRFGNIKGPNAIIGDDMVLPWRNGLENELSFDKKYLPLLWSNANGYEKSIRYAYMDKITQLYSENFTGVLAKWCNEHGVMYLGHNIEDDGAHCRLGYGPGHYFRAQKAQDYAGVDVIGTQIVPGMPFHHDAFSTDGNNGEFYHYALGKLAGSAAHLDSKKKGRAMCEAFGAYGWNEGLKLMKWIADHLMSRGINTFVPHAFNPKEFPDWDCAPHFYAHGNNPQFRFFDIFTGYLNRTLTLLNAGTTAAKVGVLYNASLEWYNGSCMPLEKILRELTEHQIDADIISEDYLKDVEINNGRYIINGVEFETLIVPECAEIPKDIDDLLHSLKSNGVDIKRIGVDLSLNDLADSCEKYRELFVDDTNKDLVYYHYIKNDMDIYFLFNESVIENVVTHISLPVKEGRKLYRYDAFKDKYYIQSDNSGADINISPYESLIFVAMKDLSDAAEEPLKSQKEKTIDTRWNISYATSLDYPKAQKVVELSEIKPLSDIDGFDSKSGTSIYESTFDYDGDTANVAIDLGMVYETAEVFVNGYFAGVRLAPPYRFDISNLISRGNNKLRIEITNTLGTQVRDGMSQYLVIEPFGMTQNPRLIY